MLWQLFVENSKYIKNDLIQQISFIKAGNRYCLMMKCLWYCLLSCSAGSAGVMESLGKMLKISVKCPSLFPHVMLSVLFNKYRAKKALCWGQTVRHQAGTADTEYRQVRNHSYRWKRQGERGREFKLELPLSQTNPRGGFLSLLRQTHTYWYLWGYL